MNALELFPCSGGMAEGFRRAGITFAHAFDKSPEACASYEANLGHRPICIDASDLLRLVVSGWRPGELDLLVADPPCTPWSRAGKRKGMADERDMLAQTCELIRLLRPRAYLIGNVPGLDDSTQWHNVQRVLAPLRKAGYCIADYASLDAADFGVPQHRVRPFWFGHLEGPCIRWPLPTHGPPSDNTCLPGTELLPWVTCRDALEHLPLELLGRPVRLRPIPRESQRPVAKPDSPAPTQTASGGRAGKRVSVLTVNPRHQPAQPAPTLGAKMRGQAGQVLQVNAKHPTADIDGLSPTVRGGGSGHSAPHIVLAAPRLEDPNRPPANADAPHRTVSAARDQALLEWPWNRPSTTVCARDTIPPPGHHPEAGSILSMPNAVVLSERAALILQGFPEDWQLLSPTKTGRWSMLGQAMPPPLAEAVARGVVEQLSAAPGHRRRRSA